MGLLEGLSVASKPGATGKPIMADSFPLILNSGAKPCVVADLSSCWLAACATIFFREPMSSQGRWESEPSALAEGNASVTWNMGPVLSCGDDSVFELLADEKWF